MKLVPAAGHELKRPRGELEVNGTSLTGSADISLPTLTAVGRLPALGSGSEERNERRGAHEGTARPGHTHSSSASRPPCCFFFFSRCGETLTVFAVASVPESPRIPAAARHPTPAPPAASGSGLNENVTEKMNTYGRKNSLQVSPSSGWIT